MLRLGRLGAKLSAAVVTAGLLVGFTMLGSDRDELVRLSLSAVPIGLLLLFAGVVTALLAGTDGDQAEP